MTVVSRNGGSGAGWLDVHRGTRCIVLNVVKTLGQVEDAMNTYRQCRGSHSRGDGRRDAIANRIPVYDRV